MNSIINKYCNEEWQEFINFHSEIRTFAKDELIFDIGEKVEGLFIVNSGKVKITKQTPTMIRLIRLASEDDIIGHRGFGGTWKYSIAAIALEPTEVIFIPIQVFNHTIKANPDFALFIIMFFAEELRDSENLADQSPVKNLIALSLLKNLYAFGLKKGATNLSYTLSRKDLASMAGTTYESTVRSLSELQKDGAIELDGKSIKIISEKKLKAFSN